MVDVADLTGPWTSLGAPRDVLGGALGALELTVGGLGGVPRERAPYVEAPRRGLGTDFGDPKESAHAPDTRIYDVF